MAYDYTNPLFQSDYFDELIAAAKPTADPVGDSALKALAALVKTTPAPAAALVKTEIGKISAGKKTSYWQALAYLYETWPGLDEDVVGNVHFRGFKWRANGQSELVRAKDAVKLAQNTVRKVNELLALLTTKNTTAANYVKAKEFYVRWFDKDLAHRRLAFVISVFAALQKGLTTSNLEIICEGDDEQPLGPIMEGCGLTLADADVFGFVVKAEDRSRFYLCKLAFASMSINLAQGASQYILPAAGMTYAATRKATQDAINSSVATMVHELTHVRTNGNTDDVGGNPDAYDRNLCLQKAINTPDDAIRNAENFCLFADEVLHWMRRNAPSVAAVRI